MSVFEHTIFTSGSPQATRGELARWRSQYVDEEYLVPVRDSVLSGDDNPVAEHLLARVLTESVTTTAPAPQNIGRTALETSQEVYLGA
jgi:hypothetical protein